MPALDGDIFYIKTPLPSGAVTNRACMLTFIIKIEDLGFSIIFICTAKAEKVYGILTLLSTFAQIHFKYTIKSIYTYLYLSDGWLQCHKN